MRVERSNHQPASLEQGAFNRLTCLDLQRDSDLHGMVVSGIRIEAIIDQVQ